MNPSEPDTPPVPEQPAEPAGSSPTQVTAPVATEPEESQQTPTKRRGTLKTFAVIVLVLVVVGGLAYGAWSLLKSSRTSTATGNKQDIAQLTVGNIGDAGDIALYPADETNSNIEGLNNQIFEGLVRFEAQTKIVPLLATGWSNPNNSTWDFDLRHNVTFHNGHTMTAADVVYSLNLAAKNDVLANAYTTTIKTVKALNNYKVEITTTNPDPFLLNRLSFLFVVDSRAPGATNTMNATGPYQLKPGTKPSAKSIQLVAYDKYHGGHVYTRALNFKVEADDASAAADLKSGKINLAGEFDSKNPGQLKGVQYQSLAVDTQTITFMALNSVAPGPLQKQAVREALRDSIDNPQLIKDSGADATPAAQLVPQSIPGYNPAIALPKRDVAKAKALLSQAGYPNGVALTIYISGGDGLPVAKEVVKQAAAAGFTITIQNQADFDKLISDMTAGKNEITLLGFGSDLLDASDTFTQAIQQTANYKSATLDDYLNQAASTIDQAKRLQILQKTSKYLYDDVAAIPLFDRSRSWVTDKPYAIQFDNGGTPGIYFWQVYTTK